QATDKNEVTFKLKAPNADLPFVFQDVRLVILPEGGKVDAGVGTGAFVLESFEPGIRTRVKRNTNDWRKDRGWVDSIETVAINDSTARISALLSGSAHVI